MERLKKRSFVLAGVLIVAGLAIQLTPRISLAAGKTEDQLEKLAPMQVDDYKMIPGQDDPGQSYKMNQMTYDELKPFGIVSRVFQNGTRSFDVVLIASNRKESFHDPRLCFTSQGYTLLEEVQKDVETSRGPIPITFAKMKSLQGEPMITAFFYRGNNGYYATAQRFAFDNLLRQLKGSIDLEGVFYRFIPTYGGATEDELVEFIKQYLEAAGKTSNGYF
ncbi:MAG: exosortase-associated EpsI family protein [Chthonomonadaceae bacterium]|nr:exosortase-associated EpsI family protein [Chthonomonadaceae bacterium]